MQEIRDGDKKKWAGVPDDVLARFREAEAFRDRFLERAKDWDRHPGDLEPERDDADVEITVTTFPDRHALTKRETTTTLGRLAAYIEKTVAAEKNGLPLVKMGRFGGGKTKAGCVRFDSNLLQIGGVEADYDGEVISFEDAVAVAEKAGLRAVVYTSPSYSRARPRWRVLAPTGRLWAPDRRTALLDRLNGLYGGCFGAESWTLSQSFYAGSVSANGAPNPDHRVELITGEPIDALHDLDRLARGRPGAGSRAGNGTIGDYGNEPRDDASLIAAILAGEHYHAELLALAARYLGRGLSPQQAVDTLRGVMLAVPETVRDDRWPDRFRSIGHLVASAGGKFTSNAEQRRAIARLTHRLADRHRPAGEIRDAVLAEAERQGMPADSALFIAGRILAEKAGAARHG